MKNEKKIWLIEQYAQKTWTVSLALAQEAARAGQNGKGYAVVAHEARVLADKLFEYTAKSRFDGENDATFKGIVDFAVMIKILSVNAALEIQRMVEISMDFNIPKSMAVFAEELRRIAVGLMELTEKGACQKPFAIPEIVSPLETATSDIFFLYSIYGYPLIENVRYINEVCYPLKADTNGATFMLRGRKVPLINCYRRFDLPYTSIDADRQTIMIVCPDRDNNADDLYAVPIDDLDINTIIYSRIGCAVAPKKEHVLSDYTRECWDVVGGDQLVFIDWKKIGSI